jgi:Fic family protein
MADLVSYANGGVHAPLVQAALVHVQFETIHPYTDGNGRVGRALIHTVLTRQGLTPTAVLPVSLVLLARSDAYPDSLTAYQYEGKPGSAAAQSAVTSWLETFLDAVEVAADQVVRVTRKLAELRAQWRIRLATHSTRWDTRDAPPS